MRKRADAIQSVIVIIGSLQIEVHGRAAVIIARIAQHAERVNAIGVGRLVAHLSGGKITLEFRESTEAIRLED
jgi:hypothetical protein